MAQNRTMISISDFPVPSVVFVGHAVSGSGENVALSGRGAIECVETRYIARYTLDRPTRSYLRHTGVEG